ncbi:class I SAM-dependent methyltransferase [soil metagenome]
MNDASFAGSIPALYEEHLVPLMFEPFAEELAQRLAAIDHGAVLETAAGAGALTRALARTLPPDVRIVATDLNEAMLSALERHPNAWPPPPRPAVAWKTADAQSLPFADGEFEAVVSQFGMMFLPDKIAGFREARRVLAPKGRFVFNLWDRLDENELSLVVDRAAAALFPQNPSRFFERAPFGYHDRARIQADLEAAGFTDVAIEVIQRTTTATADHAALGLCQGTPLRGEIEARGGDLAEVTTKVSSALHAHFGGAIFTNRMQALVVTATFAP